MSLMGYTASKIANKHFTWSGISCSEKLTWLSIAFYLCEETLNWPSIAFICVKGKVISVAVIYPAIKKILTFVQIYM